MFSIESTTNPSYYTGMNEVTIIGRSSLDDGETTTCEHCGRDIRHFVYLSNGQTVGTQCALKKMGYTRKNVDGAPLIVSDMSRVNGFFAYTMVDGNVVKMVRGCAPGGGYTAWRQC